MASDPAAARTRALRARAALATLALASAAAVAGASTGSPRVLVVCALVALAAVAAGASALRRLAAPGAAAIVEPPAPQPGAALRGVLLETQLEQAPVALWWEDAHGVAPLNNAARRLVAPGGAIDGEALRAQLRATPTTPRRQLVRYETERGGERALLAARALVVDGAAVRLLALLPVESELEAETLKAWRQLVHVLTHEIMNSLTPIASLSRTAQELLHERGVAPDDELAIALEAIARRAEALGGFVADYRRVSDWPQPRLAAVALAPLFARLASLVEAGWQARGGTLRFEVEPATLTLMADDGQLEQALLNLLANAAQATAATPVPAASVSARLTRGGRLAIEVRDNGPGVPPGLEQDIFTPFFSTREHGSGIGLAVVRHLVQGMGGSVRHARPASGGAAFVLTF